MFLTGSKRHIGKLLPCSGVVVEVSVRVELHPLRPGVVQTVVDSRGDADLVAHRDGVSCRSLREQEGVENSTKRRNFFFFWLMSRTKNKKHQKDETGATSRIRLGGDSGLETGTNVGEQPGVLT